MATGGTDPRASLVMAMRDWQDAMGSMRRRGSFAWRARPPCLVIGKEQGGQQLLSGDGMRGGEHGHDSARATHRTRHWLRTPFWTRPMTGWQFAASVISSLAWPVAVVVLAIVFRAPLRRLVSGDVRRWKAGPSGLEVEFSEPLDEHLAV